MRLEIWRKRRKNVFWNLPANFKLTNLLSEPIEPLVSKTQIISNGGREDRIVEEGGGDDDDGEATTTAAAGITTWISSFDKISCCVGADGITTVASGGDNSTQDIVTRTWNLLLLS